MPRLRCLRAILLALVVSFSGSNLAATWSIILVDLRTGEVAIGSATCVTGWDLRTLTAVLVVGKGGACAQSYVDFSGRNRLEIWNGFRNGTDPKDILASLARIDPGHQTRQYGMVDVQGRALGFSGTGASQWKGHVTGRVGDRVYAIQGNILTGAAVVAAAENAVRGSLGDLPQTLMEAMEAARRMGGDGRCSCPRGAPTSCGAPPPNFTKTADIGFMISGRLGDVDGTCTGGRGCATGSYFMNLNVIGNRSDPDPVFLLRNQYNAWRQARAGRPDHHTSQLSLGAPDLPADATTETVATLRLRDIDANPITTGGATIDVRLDPSSTAALTVGTIRDNGDGTYGIPLRAGSQQGLARLVVTVDDGSSPKITLAPMIDVQVTGDSLWISNRRIPHQLGGDMSVVINQGPQAAGRSYMLFASNSGTSPGIYLGPNRTVPVNIDALFWTVFFGAGTTLPDFAGTLDSSGRREIRIPLPPMIYNLPVASDLSFAAAVLNPISGITNPVSVNLHR